MKKGDKERDKRREKRKEKVMKEKEIVIKKQKNREKESK